MVMQFLLASQVVVLGICDLTGSINVPIVLVFTGILGMVEAIDSPARR